MAKKSAMGDAKEAVKSLAGAALGAAAAGAVGVVAETMKQMLEGDKTGVSTPPRVEKVAAKSVSSKKRSPSKKKKKAATTKLTAARGTKVKRSVKRRKKR